MTRARPASPALRARAVLALLALVAATALLFRGVFALLDRAARGRRGAVVVGSKAFTESVVLGEILAQWLETRGGVRVERRFYLGGTHIVFEALRSGAVDVYPEYTGTGLVAILHRPAQADPDAVLRAVREEFARRYDLVWLSPLGANDTYALAMARGRARALSVRSISDLARHPSLVAGFASEFLAREDGWPGLRARYGLAFAGGPRSMEAGLMYAAVARGDVDVISAYSTDGRIASLDLVVLDDDRRFFPPYQAAFVARRDALAREPALRRFDAAVAGRLSDDALRRMNAEVDSGRRSAADVAREFLATLPQ